MSNTPHPYLSDHAVLRQIVADIKEFGFGQVIPSLILSVGAFIYAWRTGQVVSFKDGLTFVLYSLAAGLALYVLLAIIRAPIIVIGWHLRQISGLSVRLAERVPETQTPTNSISGFRVTRETASSLQFEVWYFYDGKLGNDGISMYASLEDNAVGVRFSGGRAYAKASIVGHKALARFTLTYRPTGEQTSLKSTHIVLTMESDEKEAIFYRQLIPYEKTWQANPPPQK